jgi:hypothetical protein
MNDDGADIDKITRFDVEEFCNHYGYTKENMPESIDILDLGYDFKHNDSTQYEEPDKHWREELKQQ